MIWLFLFIVLGLSCMYMLGGSDEHKDIQLKNSDSFIVTAILSTLVAHGILSLAEEMALEDANLHDLQETLLGHGLLDEGDWDHLLTDHFHDNSPLIDSKDLDMG